MSFDALATFVAAMFTILNPIGNTAMFAGMVSGWSRDEQRATAIQCAIAVGVILVASIWLGELVLGFFGVSIPALETAGGLMIAMIGISMLHSQQSSMHAAPESPESPSDQHSIAIVPLAMPIVAGPGAIATLIVNTHKYQGVQSNLEMSLACLVLSIVIGACFVSIGPINRVLGAAGMSIVTKFMGMILLAIAVGMLASGIKELLPGLAG